MTPRALSAFLEACHHGPAELQPWADGVLDTMGPLASAVDASGALHADRDDRI